MMMTIILMTKIATQVLLVIIWKIKIIRIIKMSKLMKNTNKGLWAESSAWEQNSGAGKRGTHVYIQQRI